MEGLGTEVHIGDNRTLAAYIRLRPCPSKAGVRDGVPQIHRGLPLSASSRWSCEARFRPETPAR